jgi:cell division protein FtsB
MPDTDTSALSTEKIEELKKEADALEKRAREDGLIPDDDTPENGVGPQTGVVP